MIICTLKKLMEKEKVNQSTLSEETKISRPTLLQLIRNENQNIKYDTIEELCRFFKISLNELLIYTPHDITMSKLDISEWHINNNDDSEFLINVTVTIDNEEHIFSIEGSRKELRSRDKKIILKCDVTFEKYNLYKNHNLDEFLNNMLLLHESYNKFYNDIELLIEQNIYRIKNPWHISLEFNPINKKDIGDEIGEFMNEYIDFQMKVPKSKEEIHFAINETKRLENKSIQLGEKLKLLSNTTYEMIKGKPMHLSYFEKYPKELQEAREYLENLLKED
ncbi:hypothetical protein BHM04_10790 [Macrococcus sp. IME1552]|nr:helix-turn-helix transcriptional regulator [Macrococcus sp. IME1552]ATD31643.1 hypothetical protein BHM04_10790 [Macrococcus sp. IME1552]